MDGRRTVATEPASGTAAAARDDARGTDHGRTAEHEAEWALAGSISDRATYFVGLLERDGTVLEANAAALEFLGWRRDAAVGRPLWAAAPSTAARQRLREAVEEVGAGREFSAREAIRDGEGRTRLVDLTLSPFAREDGGTDLLVLVARDVTDAAATLRRLVVSREKYANIVNVAADAIISIDETYRITDFNRGAEQMFGYDAAEVIDRSLDVLLPPRSRSAHVRHVRTFGRSPVSARRMGERREISALRKGGEEFPADASISKQTIDGHRFYTVVLRDITRQKRAERSQRFLARAGSLLASSLDVATTVESIARLVVDEGVADCCVIFDAGDAGVVRRAALASAEPDLADALEPYRGESLSTASLHPAVRVVNTARPVLIPDARQLLRTAEGGRDLDLIRRIGVTSAIIVPLLARGRTGGAIGLYRISADRPFGPDDLSLAVELGIVSALAVDNARLYESARRAVRARDDILAVVSHDLGNPLAAVRIGTNVVTRALAEGGGPGTVLEHLKGIRRSVDQMERLIRDLMDVERMEMGPLAVGAKPVRAGTVVSSVIDMFAAIASAKPVSLRSRVPASLPTVRADRERLVQALSNLVGNAIKFTKAGGVVEIVVEPHDDAVCFSVCDDGPGIEPADLEHIFDRFWKVSRRDPATTTGLGLGLAIVKGIVDAHGGRVWAESEPGDGTRVRFTIPLSGQADRAGRTAVRSSPTPEKDIA